MGETLNALGLGVGSCDAGPTTSLSGSVEVGPPPPETGGVVLDCPNGGLTPPLNPGEPLVGTGEMLVPLTPGGDVGEIGPALDCPGALWPDVGEPLVPDGPPLLGPWDWFELGAGLGDPLGPPDAAEPESGLALADGDALTEFGDPELGAAMLDLPDGWLLGIHDDGAEGLTALEAFGLVADDVPDGGEAVELADVADGEVPLPLDEPIPLEPTLDDLAGAELICGLDAAETWLLTVGDESPEVLAWLPELVGEIAEPLEIVLPETPELADCPILLGPLVDDGELPTDSLRLALLAALGGGDDAPLLADDGP